MSYGGEGGLRDATDNGYPRQRRRGFQGDLDIVRAERTIDPVGLCLYDPEQHDNLKWRGRRAARMRR